MRLDEVENSLALIHQSIRILSTHFYSAETIEKIVRLYEKPNSLFGTIFVAQYGSQLVGVASAQFCLGFSGNINAVFTHPEFTHNGVGRGLVQALEQSAIENNIKVMTVLSSLTAVKFYQTLGYDYRGETTIDGVIPCVRLQKQLQPLTVKDHIQQGFLGGLVILIMLLIFL